MLHITGLNQYYGESHILRDVNLEVKAGSCACLMGRNGVGKTTLLQCIMGVLPARSGHILLEGTDLLPLPVERRAALGIGYVPQGRQIFPLLTVRENMELSLPMRKDKAGAIPPFIFDFFPVLGGAAIFPAGSSNSLPLPGRSRWSRACSFWTNQPRAFSPTLCATSPQPFADSTKKWVSQCCWWSRKCLLPAAWQIPI